MSYRQLNSKRRALESLESRTLLTATVETWDLNHITESSSPHNFAEVNGTIFFTAQGDDELGIELWRTDGTDVGTSRVLDIFPGRESSQPQDLTNINGKLFFSAVGSVGAGRELWTSDGTASGTIQLSDILPGQRVGSDPTSFVNWNGRLLYVIDSFKYGYLPGILGVSDGTISGTHGLPGFIDSRDHVFQEPPAIAVHEERVFATNGEYYDNGGDKLVYHGFGPLANSTTRGRFQELHGDIYLAVGVMASAGFTYRPGLIRIIPDDVRGFTSAQVHSASQMQTDTLTEVAGKLYFAADNELWVTDGTSEALLAAVPGDMSQTDLANVNGILYFTGADGELWRTDGTIEGTRQVKELREGEIGSTPRNLTNINGTLVFAANDGIHGFELWNSDGTAEGTVPVKDIRPGANGSSPAELANLAGTLYFRANDGTTGYELWKSDLTEGGTRRVADIRHKTADASPSFLVNLHGTLFFSADDGAHGRELWKKVGTAAPELVADLSEGIASSDPQEMTVLGDRIVFTSDVGDGREMWSTDGTTIFRLADVRTADGAANPMQLTGMGNAVYFTANDETHGEELWKTDGTPAGTTLVIDLVEGTNNSSPRNLVAVGERLYFKALEQAGIPIWSTDGTAPGTREILHDSDLELTSVNGTVYGSTTPTVTIRWGGGTTWIESSTGGTAIHIESDGHVTPIGSKWEVPPTSITDVNGIAYFAASAGSDAGMELWRSDGTTNGTYLVRDLMPGTIPTGFLNAATPLSSVPTDLTNVNGTLYFVANDESGARSLWMSDGTTAGTVLLRRFTQARDSVSNLTNVEGSLYFTANDGETGNELWRTDGTAVGTVLVADLNPGPASADPIELVAVGSALYFNAIDHVYGSELRSVSIAPLGDFNGDGKVDNSDASLMFEQWGNSGSSDLNHDGIVDALDAAILFGNWSVE